MQDEKPKMKDGKPVKVMIRRKDGTLVERKPKKDLAKGKLFSDECREKIDTDKKSKNGNTKKYTVYKAKLNGRTFCERALILRFINAKRLPGKVNTLYNTFDAITDDIGKQKLVLVIKKHNEQFNQASNNGNLFQQMILDALALCSAEEGNTFADTLAKNMQTTLDECIAGVFVGDYAICVEGKMSPGIIGGDKYWFKPKITRNGEGEVISKITLTATLDAKMHENPESFDKVLEKVYNITAVYKNAKMCAVSALYDMGSDLPAEFVSVLKRHGLGEGDTTVLRCASIAYTFGKTLGEFSLNVLSEFLSWKPKGSRTFEAMFECGIPCAKPENHSYFWNSVHVSGTKLIFEPHSILEFLTKIPESIRQIAKMTMAIVDEVSNRFEEKKGDTKRICQNKSFRKNMTLAKILKFFMTGRLGSIDRKLLVDIFRRIASEQPESVKKEMEEKISVIDANIEKLKMAKTELSKIRIEIRKGICGFQFDYFSKDKELNIVNEMKKVQLNTVCKNITPSNGCPFFSVPWRYSITDKASIAGAEIMSLALSDQTKYKAVLSKFENSVSIRKTKADAKTGTNVVTMSKLIKGLPEELSEEDKQKILEALKSNNSFSNVVLPELRKIAQSYLTEAHGLLPNATHVGGEVLVFELKENFDTKDVVKTLSQMKDKCRSMVSKRKNPEDKKKLSDLADKIELLATSLTALLGKE